MFANIACLNQMNQELSYSGLSLSRTSLYFEQKARSLGHLYTL